MNKATINLIVADAKQDQFMHAADVFEPFKRLGQILSMEYEFQKSEPDQAFVDRLKDQFNSNGYIVTAIWIAQDPKVNYIDWNVKVFSNGENWALLEDYLKQFGITKPIQQNEKQV